MNSLLRKLKILGEIEEALNKWRAVPYPWIRKFSNVKMQSVLINMPGFCVCVETNKLI